MSARKFRDEQGRRWQVRARSKGDWRFEPLRGNPAPPRRAVPPLYADDPFELSERELGKILASASPPAGERPAGDGSARPPSPFLDDPDPRPRRPRSPFGDEDEEPPRPASPFDD